MNRRVLGEMKALPIEQVEKYIGEQIGILRVANRPNALQMAMSIAEYLKDARRWQYILDHGMVINDLCDMTPSELLRFIDQERKK